jgi:tetratricopeptide (TPR) repeat protein
VGEHEKAIQDIEASQHYEPAVISLMFGAAWYLEQHDLPNVRYCIERAKSAPFTEADIKLNLLGDIYINRLDLMELDGEYEAGLVEVEWLLQESTASQDILLIAQFIFQLHLGKTQDAQKTLGKLQKDHRFSPHTGSARIRMAFFQRDYAEVVRLAQEEFEQLRLVKPEAIWYIYLAEGHRGLGNTAAALAAYRKAGEIADAELTVQNVMIRNFINRRAPDGKLSPDGPLTLLHGVGVTGWNRPFPVQQMMDISI